MWFIKDKQRSDKMDMEVTLKENRWSYVFASLVISTVWTYLLIYSSSKYNKLQLLLTLMVIISSFIVGVFRAHTLLSKRSISSLQAKVIANATSLVVIGVFAEIILDIIK